MASRTVAREKHGGKTDKVLTVDFAKLDAEFAAAKRAERVNPPGSFCSEEYAAANGINKDCARARLGKMKKAGLVRTIPYWKDNKSIHGWQIIDKDKT